MTCKFCELITGTAEVPEDLNELCSKHIILILRKAIASMGDTRHLDFRARGKPYINRLLDELDRRMEGE
jgi:hypothetical protein